MAIINCGECGGKVSDTAVTCPHCGAAVALAVTPVKTGSKVWMYVIGIPVGLFILVMVVGALNSNPQKTQDRRTYEACIGTLADADRSRSGSGGLIAGACEGLRSDFVKKWGSTP